MDERIAIWNILADGKITAVSEEGDTLTVVVSLPRLRRRLKPLGDCFVLTLTGVRQAEYRGLGCSGAVLAIREGIENDAPEILSAGSRAMPITIEIGQNPISPDETTRGQIILDFQSIRLALDTGQAIDYQTIYTVYEEWGKEILDEYV